MKPSGMGIGLEGPGDVSTAAAALEWVAYSTLLPPDDRPLAFETATQLQTLGMFMMELGALNPQATGLGVYQISGDSAFMALEALRQYADSHDDLQCHAAASMVHDYEQAVLDGLA